MKQLLKIGELAALAEISTDTLRFYEKHRLLTPSARGDNGYRLYSQADVQRISFIRGAKAVGFTLSEIGELLSLEVTKEQQSCRDVKKIVDDKLLVIEQRMQELQRIEQSLHRLSDACCGGNVPATHCTILEALSQCDSDYLTKGD